MAKKCDSNGLAWLVLIIGILFLLVDLGVWTFGGIQWWSIFFIIWGLYALKKGCIC